MRSWVPRGYGSTHASLQFHTQDLSKWLKVGHEPESDVYSSFYFSPISFVLIVLIAQTLWWTVMTGSCALPMRSCGWSKAPNKCSYRGHFGSILLLWEKKLESHHSSLFMSKTVTNSFPQSLWFMWAFTDMHTLLIPWFTNVLTLHNLKIVFFSQC